MAEQLPPLPLPNEAMWSAIGVSCGRELHGGHQSRVFAAHHGDASVVVKLTDSRMVDKAFDRRLEITAHLAEVNGSVVAPIPARDGLVTEMGDWFAVIFPFIDGATPQIDHEADVRMMASTLADLHRSFAQLDHADVPPVLAIADVETLHAAEGWSVPQLLHGDFSTANLLISEARLRVFDFAECGSGPVEFEIGNSVYTVLFDAALSSDPVRAERFRAWFVSEYRQASDCQVRDELVDAAIQIRIRALQRWLDQPTTAPIGIRTATEAWRTTLRSFVRSHLTA